jgi:hypothetical protein
MTSLNRDERYVASHLGIYATSVGLGPKDQSPHVPSAFEQIIEAQTGGTGPYPALFPFSNLIGDLIIVQVEIDLNQIGASNPNLTVSVNDSQGNVYTQIDGVGGQTIYSWASGNQHGHSSALFIAQNIKAGPNTVTAAITGGLTGSVLSGIVTAAEYNSNGGVGITYAANVEFTASNPNPVSVNVNTVFPNQIVLYISSSGGANLPAAPAPVARATGWTEWTIPTATSQTYSATNVSNTSNYAWGIAF